MRIREEITLARELVNKGIQLLNRKNPGWAERINVDVFDIQSNHLCILGQLYGTYSDGRYALDIKLGCEYGFCYSDEVSPDTLNNVWFEFFEGKGR